MPAQRSSEVQYSLLTGGILAGGDIYIEDLPCGRSQGIVSDQESRDADESLRCLRHRNDSESTHNEDTLDDNKEHSGNLL